jgi:hypothetical protein
MQKNQTYFTYSLNDVNGTKDVSPVSSTLRATADSTLLLNILQEPKE